MENWYSVKGLFRWYYKESGETAQIEERIILIRATNIDMALDKAEEEAVAYCEEDTKANYKIEPLNKYYAYDIVDRELESGTEIFSFRRETEVKSEVYLERFYPETI